VRQRREGWSYAPTHADLLPALVRVTAVMLATMTGPTKLVSAPTVAEMRSGEQRGAGADRVRMPTGRAGVCADHACTRSPRKRELIDRPARVNGMYCYAMLSAASEGPHPNILGAPALPEPLSRRASARFEPPGFRHHRDSLRPMPEVR